MGVYVFRSRHEEWVKVGHHKATRARPNAFYRIAGRGFQSVVHPPCLEGRLYVSDLELVAWYPNLERKDETFVHRSCDKERRVGEFHPSDQVPHILRVCEEELGGKRKEVSSQSRKKAIRWGARRVAAAERRRRKKEG